MGLLGGEACIGLSKPRGLAGDRWCESGKAIGFFTFHFPLFTFPFPYTKNIISIWAMITLTNMPRG